MKHFKNQTLLCAAVVGTMMSMPSHAIYNLYKKDGLSLDLHGELNLNAQSNTTVLTGQTPTLSTAREELSDERVRLQQDLGASWLDVHAAQKLENDLRVSGTVGFGYTQPTGVTLNNANVALDKKNVGAISVGRQYLHTGHVTRTGTFTPLDIFGEQSVRVDYYGTPNLHTSVYYALPSSTDTRATSDAQTKGYGASAVYQLPLTATQSLRLGAGYSHNEANPTTNSIESINANSDNYALSAEYRVGKLVLAGDVGRRTAKLNGRVVSGSNVDYVGIKAGYKLTPSVNVMAGYGTRNSKRTYVDGQKAVAQGALSGLGLSATTRVPFLFDTLNETHLYVRGDYYVRENLRLYGQADKITMQAKQDGQNYGKLDDTAYRLGVSFAF